MRKTDIQWTNSTHNFWSGCRKVSEGCKFCYMHRIIDKQGKDPNTVRRADDKYFYLPYYDKEPKLIFTCSMSDFFIEEADQWRERAWATIKHTPWHTWQILTKRPERILDCLPADWGDGYPNVWLGVTVENQKSFHRVETLSGVPAVTKFISAEPLLGEVDILVTAANGKMPIKYIDWVIVGGESGYDTGKYRYRECKVEWMERIAHDLRANTEAKLFVKQMGTYLAKQGVGSGVRIGWVTSWHGADFNKFPPSLQVQEIPVTAGIRKAA